MVTLQPNGALRVRCPPKFVPLWTSPRRYTGMRGGRGSAKSHQAAEFLVNRASYSHVRASCMREIQLSIKDSVKQLLEDKIHQNFGTDQTRFKITDKEIVCKETDSLFIFRGLQNHTAASIKSLEGFNYAWYEEAQTLSERSIELATPTFRRGSIQLFSWNPEDETDPVDKLFLPNVADNDPDFLLIRANYSDNPWFPDELRRDMERDKKRDMDKYLHIWEGEYRRNSQARVFKNVTSFAFDTPEEAFFQHGADWGFAVDPTVLVRCFVGTVGPGGTAIYDPLGDTLFIDYEAYSLQCEIDNTPALFDSLVPDQPEVARKWQIRADSARPETISYMQKHDYPLMVRATKGPNSIKDGIEFIKNYNVVVHPRCVHTLDEFKYYSFKIDPKTNAITNVLEDKKNHVIDSVRYAVELLRRPALTWSVS